MNECDSWLRLLNHSETLSVFLPVEATEHEQQDDRPRVCDSGLAYGTDRKLTCGIGFKGRQVMKRSYPPIRAMEATVALVTTVSAGVVLSAKPNLIPGWLAGPPVAFLIWTQITAVVSASVVAASARSAGTPPNVTGLRVGRTFAATIAIIGALFWTTAGTWGLDSGQAATLALAELLAVVTSFAAAWAVGAGMSRWGPLSSNPPQVEP